jgi:hypothetical protein
MRERATGIVRWINEDALYLTRELLFECFEREQIIAEDESVIEVVIIRDTLLSVIRLFRFLKQDSRLKPRPVLFPNPGELKFLLLHFLA